MQSSLADCASAGVIVNLSAELVELNRRIAIAGTSIERAEDENQNQNQQCESFHGQIGMFVERL